MITSVYPFEKYNFRKILVKFSNINCKTERRTLKVCKTARTDQRHESGILKHAHAEENVTTVDKLVGPRKQESQKQTHRSIRQISKEIDLAECSIVQIIHCFLS